MLKQVFSAEEKEIKENLFKHHDIDIKNATARQLYFTFAHIAKDKILQKKLTAKNTKPQKEIHYLSIEFLFGRFLKNNLWNLDLIEKYTAILKKYGKDINDVFDVEKDAGLGNGGLGRLASCYFDSLTTGEYNATGHTLLYEYGLFHQQIKNCRQVETSQEWLNEGAVWLEEKKDDSVIVEVGGYLKERYQNNKLYFDSEETIKIRAIPYDLYICGYKTNAINCLKLWKAEAQSGFDIAEFSTGNFLNAYSNKVEIEAINKILYPDDKNTKGRELRLLQQYFLVSATAQYILKEYFKKHKSITQISSYLAVHINDTHPALIICEIIRLLIDKYNFGWDESWDAVKKVMSYTNHTILSESLEVKSYEDIKKLIPRIAKILEEINRRARIENYANVTKNDRQLDEMSIILNGNAYMANLSLYSSKIINGVAKIHSQILKDKLFKNYAQNGYRQIVNITNGITHRRWLCQSNEKLTKLIESLIGNKFYKNADELKKLSRFANNDEVIKEFLKIKFENKKRYAEFLLKKQGIVVDPMARFDVQIKRIHEYKRQLLNVLKIIYLCEEIRKNPTKPVVPQVFIFGGKAAAGYALAKEIIYLINKLAEEVAENKIFKNKIQIVFAENYNVTMAEILMPATDVSEQISLAGQEASGTGNMKAVLNGALMICTEDGANIEIMEKCGKENSFAFGLKSEEIDEIKRNGYSPLSYYEKSEKAQIVIDKLRRGIAGEQFNQIADYLMGQGSYIDQYMCLADLDSYIKAHEKMDETYKDQKKWAQMCLKSIANMGYFSSDRSIAEYDELIWKTKPQKSAKKGK